MSTRLLPAIFCDQPGCRRWTSGECDTAHVLRAVCARWGWRRDNEEGDLCPDHSAPAEIDDTEVTS